MDYKILFQKTVKYCGSEQTIIVFSYDMFGEGELLYPLTIMKRNDGTIELQHDEFYAFPESNYSTETIIKSIIDLHHGTTDIIDWDHQ